MPDRRQFFESLGGLFLPTVLRSPPGLGWSNLPVVPDADPGELITHTRRVLTAAEAHGIPLSAGSLRAVEALPAAEVTEALQRVLDRWCLVDIHVNPEMRVKVARGPAGPHLVRGDWRAFLVKVRNEAGTTAALRASRAHAGETADRWLEASMMDDPPLAATLSGLELEYRILRLYSHEAGWREASLTFDVGQGTQDLGFRNELPILFDCRRLTH
jgi:hypothetical protein